MTGHLNSNDIPTDASVHYRTDGYGLRVAVLPATCRYGHALGAGGYRVRESNGLLRVRCAACASNGVSDPYWTLAGSGPAANLAELDGTPYAGLRQR